MILDYCEAVVDCCLPIDVSQDEIVTRVEETRGESGVDGTDFEPNHRSEPDFMDHEDPLVPAVEKNIEASSGTQVVPVYQ